MHINQHKKSIHFKRSDIKHPVYINLKQLKRNIDEAQFAIFRITYNRKIYPYRRNKTKTLNTYTNYNTMLFLLNKK